MPDFTPPKTNELDVLVVKNIDLDCNAIDTTDYYPHKEYFQVKWGGKPHRIAPGQSKKMPRFLAEHYAKHLADHILMKMEETSKRRGLVNSAVERPAVLSQIITSVDTYFNAENNEDDIVTEDVQPEERAVDVGEVPNPMMGVLKTRSVPTPEPVVTPVDTKETSIWDESKAKPSRDQLVADCDKLGIELTGKESVDELIEKIKKF